MSSSQDYFLYEEMMGYYNELIYEGIDELEARLSFLEIIKQLILYGGTYTKIRGLEAMTYLMRMEHNNYNLLRRKQHNSFQRNIKFELSKNILDQILDWWIDILPQFSEPKILTTIFLFLNVYHDKFSSEDNFIQSKLNQLHNKLMEVKVYKKMSFRHR